MDFQKAVETMSTMSRWSQEVRNADDLQTNAQIAARAFAMLLLARAYLFKLFLELMPDGTDVFDARRRWIYLQVMPPSVKHEKMDMFAKVVTCLRYATENDMVILSGSIVTRLIRNKPELFLCDDIFLTVDEAQAGSEMQAGRFPCTAMPADLEVTRSSLHEFYRFCLDTKMFQGFILSGTGLSRDIVQKAVHSGAAKYMGEQYTSSVFTHTGSFLDWQVHHSYIYRYLFLDEEVESDRRLLQRMKHWLAGRC
jgi:hypothetical protein